MKRGYILTNENEGGHFLTRFVPKEEQSRHSRESGNPGGITTGKCIFFLDASLRWHDGPEPIKTTWTEYQEYHQTWVSKFGSGPETSAPNNDLEEHPGRGVVAESHSGVRGREMRAITD